MSLASDRLLPPQPQPAAPRGLPALNPPPPPPPAATSTPTSISPPNMSSSSGESSPDAPPASRPSIFTRSISPPPAPAPATLPQPPRPTLFGGPEPSRTDSGSGAASDPEGLYATSTPPVPPNTERRRDYTARMRLGRGHPPSDYDSDEDPADLMETESETLSFLEQFSVGNIGFHGRDDELRIRAQQVIRGQLTNKRVASRKAIGQLQSVEISTLDEGERCKFRLALPFLLHKADRCVQPALSATMSSVSPTLRVSTKPRFVCLTASIFLATTVSRSGSRSRIVAHTAGIRSLRNPSSHPILAPFIILFRVTPTAARDTRSHREWRGGLFRRFLSYCNAYGGSFH